MKTWQRHLISILLAAGLVGLFTLGRADLHPVHIWNRAFADAAFVMLCLTLMIGPAVRFVQALSPLLPLRRELGIWLAVAAAIHAGIYAGSVYQWNVLGLFTEQVHERLSLLRNTFGAANWVGALALLYMAVLAITSNDASQRVLGRGWKFLQQQSYTLFILAVVHAGIFLYIVIEGGYGVFLPAFWAAALFTAGLQLGGYARTVWQQVQRRRLDERSN